MSQVNSYRYIPVLGVLSVLLVPVRSIYLGIPTSIPGNHMRVVAEGHGCTTHRYAYIFYDVECDRSDFARLYSVPVLNRSPPSVSSRWFFVNKPVSCIRKYSEYGYRYRYE